MGSPILSLVTLTEKETESSRQIRVREISRSIECGEYKIDSDTIARKLLDSDALGV